MTQVKEVTTKRMAQKKHSHLEAVPNAVPDIRLQTVTSGKSESAIGKPQPKPKPKKKAKRVQPKKKEGKKPSGRSKSKKKVS